MIVKEDPNHIQEHAPRNTWWAVIGFLVYLLAFVFFQKNISGPILGAVLLPAVLLPILSPRLGFLLTAALVPSQLAAFLFVASQLEIQAEDWWLQGGAILLSGAVAYFQHHQARLSRKIVEQRSLISALKLQEERFRTLSEHSADVTILVNEDFKTFFVSDSVEQVMGYSPDEIQGNFRTRFLHPDSTAFIDRTLEQLVGRHGETLTLPPIRGRHQDGRWRYFEGSLTNMLNVPSVRGYVFIGRDVTERIEAENQKNESEERYRLLVETSPDAIAIHDGGKIVYLNPACVRLLGGSRAEDFLGLQALDFVHPEHREIVSMRIRDILEHDIQAALLEEKFVRLDGETLYAEVAASMVHYLGKPAVQVIIRDITKRKETEKALQDAKFRFEALFSQNKDGVTIISLDGFLLDGNQRLAEMLGYSRQEIIGKRFDYFTCEEELSDTRAKLEALLRDQSIPMYERTLVKQNGVPLNTEINATLVKDQDGNPLHIQTIIRDISERKRTEQALQHLATHDHLTGLPNRFYFFEQFKKLLTYAQEKEARFALFYIDLNDFKIINDQFGHQQGDQVLQALASRLQQSIQPTSTVARMGGDEFTILLHEISDVDLVGDFSSLVLDIIAEPFQLDGFTASVSGSIGWSIFPDHGKSIEKLISQADRAMYTHKERLKSSS
jgi:diguanylate cyclase (GGDEF)-like protein/PAS domain S-box-containing protein